MSFGFEFAPENHYESRLNWCCRFLAASPWIKRFFL